MIKGLIFFCCACAILLFTIINLSIGPIVSRSVGSDWGDLNCARLKDLYDEDKDSGIKGDELKYGKKWDLNMCTRKKGMYDMEYTSFIFDIVIGFICGLLGLLHYFELKKEFVSKTGLIGLGCGIVGFILTFVYVIFNGLVYTKYKDHDTIKRNSDGAFAERKGTSTNFNCLYFDKLHNYHSLYASYSDLGKKQYNYDKDLYKSISTSCINDNWISACYLSETIVGPSDCKYLYAEKINEIKNKDISDRFLTTLILSLLVCLANIGLALFGFLLFRSPGEF